MSEEHFIECFCAVEFCHLDPGSMPSAVEEGFSEKFWSVEKHEGAWVPGLSAGGRPDSEAYATNPQYIVTLDEEDDQGDGCRIIVALLQKDRRWFQSREDMWLPINFHVYEIEDPGSSSRRLTAEDFEKSQLVGCCDAYEPGREVMKRLHLYPGTFCVVPSTHEADQAGDFLLRIYTEKESTCGSSGVKGDARKCNEKPLKMQFFEGCSGGYVSDDDMKAAFDELASADGTISIKSLQKLLNKLSALGNQPVEFSMEFCRIMMTYVDEDRTESIDFHEFKRLHNVTEVLRVTQIG
ncbi:calpain-11 [Rhipicephalus sanguineus]|uniref:calpain-11 n=1 Tax=Rhipicephalus sanguineus TaxID=34632 RepID=UPI0020C1F434|nr:calpain-11 [Rhipicephalus sanguineus]